MPCPLCHCATCITSNLFCKCCSRCRFQPYDCVIVMFALWSRFSPPSNFVNWHVFYSVVHGLSLATMKWHRGIDSMTAFCWCDCSICDVHDDWTWYYGWRTSALGTSGVPCQVACPHSPRHLQFHGIPGQFIYTLNYCCMIFTTRCYASAVLAMGLCLSLRQKSEFY